MTLQPQEPTALRPATTHSMAIVSLVLSILGLMPPILPLVGSIAGVITGMMARKEILARPDLYTGEGIARAGIILGWVGIGLMLAACLVAVLGILFFSISTSTSGAGPSFVITVMP